MSLMVQDTQIELTDKIPATMDLLISRNLPSVIYLPYVAQIREYAYYGCSSVNKVIMPYNPSLTIIKNYAFANCGTLTIKCLFTRDMWNNITKEQYWADGSTITIVCSDD